MNNGIERKLCAILAADVVGYSDLMHADEEATIQALKECRGVVDAIIESYGGRIIFAAGDSVVAEFALAGNCVLCAQDMQAAIDARNGKRHAGPDMLFRIGLNVGDVVINNDDLLGEGVNIAARLEALAVPGGVYLSGSVYDQVTADPTVTDHLTIEAIGNKKLKNIAEPIRVYQLIKSEPSEALERGPAEPPPDTGYLSDTGALQFETPDGPVTLVIGKELAIGRIVNREADHLPIAVGVSHAQVSRIGRQALIEYLKGSFTITDLDSSNGTFLNDDPLVPRQSRDLTFEHGPCEISVGGGRNPPKKGDCRIIVNVIEAPDPTLRLSLDRSILEDPDLTRSAGVWADRRQDARRVWVLGTGRILIGGDPDCGVSLRGAARQAAKVAVDWVQGQYFLSPIGPGDVSLNGELLKEQTAVSDGDVLGYGELGITISTLQR